MFGTCILCTQSQVKLTSEHIFPEAAGGKISEYLLCKPCNDNLGLYIDAPYLNQKHIQLARVTYQIKGKTGKIPQPFSETYSVANNESTLRIKFDSAFAPRVVQQAPTIDITDTGELKFELSVDARDRKNLPKIIRTTLSRFFESGSGKALQWSPDNKERAIQKSIRDAINASEKIEKITTPLKGSWVIDLKAIFTQYVKVIYELGCMEFKNNFMESASGKQLRAFLQTQCVKKPEPWDWMEKARQLGIVPQIPPVFDNIIEQLTDNAPETYHLAVVTRKSIVCSMLGAGVLFQINGLEDSDLPSAPKVYLCGINGGKTGIFNLHELIPGN